MGPSILGGILKDGHFEVTQVTTNKLIPTLLGLKLEAGVRGWSVGDNSHLWRKGADYLESL